MPVRPRHLLVGASTVIAAVVSLSGCSQKATGGDGSIKVTASDSKCEVSRAEFPAGHLTLDVDNTGSKVTEVYVLFPDGRIAAERENIGPGTKASITAEIKAGDYEIACKPGMKGDGIHRKVAATGKNTAAERSPEIDAAVAGYRSYVLTQAEETLPKAKAFADAVKAGDIETAKKLYAPSRIGWERTEPVAESFGDIDPKVDIREDGLEAGQDPEKDWTGWHRLEKALWQDKKIDDQEKRLADRLVADLNDWVKRVGTAEITPTSMANGAKELLDEVARNKITGEEDRYSHTDLVDFKGNLEGAQKSYELLKPVAAKNNPGLTRELDGQFTALTGLLDKYRIGAAGYEYTSYDKVTEPQRKELSDGVNALAEPLSKLAAAVVK
ncbi:MULTISPECIES: iron uptake system protein EfeO [Streptomyces]|uniref:Peptidase M75 family protein n=1 Tax=Streptomyces griseocarneus TaxID=51201 RepID=A0ABX7RKR6_9ACTN|nr:MULTISPECIES: iron uptake system protein EfeO [Streptomyces]QSY48522.1 peptidase M75 family protein [Streptomyces griseocarneus]